MFTPFIAVGLLLFFAAIAYTGELRGFLLKQLAFYKQLRVLDVALGAVAVVVVPLASYGIVTVLLPVAPVIANAVAAHPSSNPFALPAWVVVSLDSLLAVMFLLLLGSIAETVKEYVSKKHGMRDLLIGSGVVSALCLLNNSATSMATWYVLQILFGTVVYFGYKVSGAKPEAAAQRVGSTYATQVGLVMLALLLLTSLSSITKLMI